MGKSMITVASFDLVVSFIGWASAVAQAPPPPIRQFSPQEGVHESGGVSACRILQVVNSTDGLEIYFRQSPWGGKIKAETETKPSDIRVSHSETGPDAYRLHLRTGEVFTAHFGLPEGPGCELHLIEKDGRKGVSAPLYVTAPKQPVEIVQQEIFAAER